MASEKWSSGLFGCFSDCSSCCLTLWCPCIIYGRISNILDREATSCCLQGAAFAALSSLTMPVWLLTCSYRTRMRHQLGLDQTSHCCGNDPFSDCMLHLCCLPCALCQEYRELKNRGFYLSAGWEGNVEKQSRGVQMVPKMGGDMIR